jgi:hypothetical protein
MKKMRNLAKYGFGAILLLGSQALLAQQRYSQQVFETPGFVVEAMNDHGVIAGRVNTSVADISYSAATIARPRPVYGSTGSLLLPISPTRREGFAGAFAINNSGVAAGLAVAVGGFRNTSAAVFYPSPKNPEQYSIVPIFRMGEGYASVALGINDIGWVIGSVGDEKSPQVRPFVWIPNSEDRTQGVVYMLPCAMGAVYQYGSPRTITDGPANAIGGECNRKPYVWIYGVDVDLTSWLPTSIQVHVIGYDLPRTVSRTAFLSTYGYRCSVDKITNNWRLLVSCDAGFGDSIGRVSFITQGEEGLQQPLVQFSLGPKTRYDRPPARAYNSLVLTDINEAGCVVGYDGGDVVFSYCNGGFSHLDLPPGFSHGSYSNGVEHTRINDNGQVLVNSRTTAAAALGRPVLFTPVP